MFLSKYETCSMCDELLKQSFISDCIKNIQECILHSGYSDTFTFPDMIDLNTQNREILTHNGIKTGIRIIYEITNLSSGWLDIQSKTFCSNGQF